MDSLPKRKQNRLTGYDYSQPGCYFVTICSRDREHLFGCVVGADVLIGPPLGKLQEGRPTLILSLIHI